MFDLSGPAIALLFAVFTLPPAGIPFLAAALAPTLGRKLVVAPVTWLAAVNLISDGGPAPELVVVSLAAAGIGAHRTVQQGRWTENLAVTGSGLIPLLVAVGFDLDLDFELIQGGVATVAAVAAMVVLVRNRPDVAAFVVPAALLIGGLVFEDPVALFLLAVALFVAVALATPRRAASEEDRAQQDESGESG